MESEQVLTKDCAERLALSELKTTSEHVLVNPSEPLDAESDAKTVSVQARVAGWVREAESDE
jgi:hypothetical protein